MNQKSPTEWLTMVFLWHTYQAIHCTIATHWRPMGNHCQGHNGIGDVIFHVQPVPCFVPKCQIRVMLDKPRANKLARLTAHGQHRSGVGRVCGRDAGTNGVHFRPCCWPMDLRSRHTLLHDTRWNQTPPITVHTPSTSTWSQN